MFNSFDDCGNTVIFILFDTKLWYNINNQTKGKNMNAIKKLIAVLAKNLGLTIVLFAAIILFAVFSDGLLAGLITALSALIAYTCCELLYREYKSFAPAKAPTKSGAKRKK